MSRKGFGLGAFSVFVFVCVGLAATVLTFSGGCQTPGKVVSVSQSPVCPTCKVETVTSAVKGMNFTTYKCPSCGKTYEIDTSGGYLPPKEVAVCPKCGSMVQECPICKKMHESTK